MIAVVWSRRIASAIDGLKDRLDAFALSIAALLGVIAYFRVEDIDVQS